MSAWRRLLHSWAGRLPTRIIHAEQSASDASHSPLFERGHVFTVRLPLIGEVNCYLHHYLRSDPDRGLHDHPWPWATALPLAGGYREERHVGLRMGVPAFATRRRRPFVPYRLTGYDYHRVVVEAGATNWSLFFTGRNAFKPWGFLRPISQQPIVGSTVTAVLQPGAQYVVASNEDGNHTAWWRSAPLGRLYRRAPP